MYICWQNRTTAAALFIFIVFIDELQKLWQIAARNYFNNGYLILLIKIKNL